MGGDRYYSEIRDKIPGTISRLHGWEALGEVCDFAGIKKRSYKLRLAALFTNSSIALTDNSSSSINPI